MYKYGVTVDINNSFRAAVSIASSEVVKGMSSLTRDYAVYAQVFFFLRQSRTENCQGYRSPERTPPDFPPNMPNKCTLINQNSPWTSRMKNELQYERSYSVELRPHKFLTFPRLWAFSLPLAEFPDISRFQEIPGKW